ncbi:unnamed protein product [Musa acuminata subsp. burmannicoides]
MLGVIFPSLKLRYAYLTSSSSSLQEQGSVSLLQLMSRSREMILSILLTLAAAVHTASQNCSGKCGQVVIPYPFGIEPGCFRDGFAITCNQSTGGPPRAFLGASDIEVTEISLPQGQVRVQVPVAWQCYNESGTESFNLPEINYNINGVYKISNDRNKFTIIGCNSLVYLQSQKDGIGSYPFHYYVGCLSYCRDVTSVINGACDGIGCCQSSFPAKLSDSSFLFKDYSHSSMLDFSPCTYAFIVDHDYFSFSAANLMMDKNSSMPLWLDWAFRAVATCDEAARSTNYACRSENSVCINSRNDAGYLCNCSQGFQGNPYIDKGCQADIDECTLPETYPCYGVCTNLPGSYRCACRSGERGNPLAAPCIPNTPSAVKVIAGITSAFLAALALILVLLVLQKRRLTMEKEKLSRENCDWILYDKMMSRQVHRMRIFSLQDLQRATDNFHEDGVIGRGGHGIVYKGVLDDDRVVAIKRTVVTDERQSGTASEFRQKEEFLNEIGILSQINHKNVVRLFGCCLEEEIPMLVYEFVPNGTLSDFIHKQDPGSAISLDIRLKLAAESAEALAHLHSSTSHTVIHGDVKSSNILLDENKMAKVADFGASTLMLTDETKTVSFVQGTPGYIDPVYCETRRLTKKTDVFSFGVVILELMTRKKAIWDDVPLALMSRQHLLDILDEEVVEEGGKDLLGKVVDLAIQCVCRQQEERPTMKRVAEKLQKFRKLLQKKRGQSRSVGMASLLTRATNSFAGYQRLRESVVLEVGS